MPSINYNELYETAEFSSGFDSPPAGGPYRSVVLGVKEKITSTKKPSLSVRLKVVEGEQEGKTFFDNLTVTQDSPRAMGIFFEKFVRYGGNLEAIKMGASLEQGGASMVGTTVDVTLEDHDWNGRSSVRVKWVNAVAGGSETPVSAPVSSGVPF